MNHCPIQGCPNPAVPSDDRRVFEPCWSCQSEGWGITRSIKTVPAWPRIITALSTVGVLTSVLLGWWGFALLNAVLLGVGAMNSGLRREVHELRGARRRRAELAGQVEHEGPPELPAARSKPRLAR